MQIETNTPMPRRIKNLREGKFRWYPFSEMKPAETMFFPNEPKGSMSAIAAFAYQYAAHKTTATKKVRFSAKSIDGGVRIKRLNDEKIKPDDVALVARSMSEPRTNQKYPFVEMEVGESVFFEGVTRVVDCKAYTAAKVHAYRRRKAGDQCKFAASASPLGVRIWRVE